jgi:hypothetical protein
MMKTDELRHELDALAGDPPPVDDALRTVTVRVRRRRAGLGAGAVALCLAAAVALAISHDAGHPSQITVQNPPTGPAVDIAGLSWVRAAAPWDVRRIVTANGETFAVGADRGKPAIAEIGANGLGPSVDPTAGYDLPIRSGAVNDLVGIPGALVAVGESANAPNGAEHADAWRSTDGGHSWHSVRVEVIGFGAQAVMRRAAVSDGAVYAVGMPADASGNLGCPVSVWKSTDGTDFHVVPGQFLCAGPVDAAAGPAGLLITTMDNATAWHRRGNEWSPRSMSNEQGAPVAIAGGEDGYVAVGSTASGNDITGAIWWSPDGRTWERVATAASPADPGYRQAQFSAVAHSAAGWIAVGVRVHAGHELRATDAIVWTSPDGRRWSPVTRDGGAFEQFARADGVGATTDGFAIFGKANMTASDVATADEPIRSDAVMWFGAGTPPTPTGILEGSLLEVGGPPPGLPRGLPGTINLTGPDGRTSAIDTGADGRYSMTIDPGTYHAFAHSPGYALRYDCPPFTSGADTSADPIVIEPDRVVHIDFICSIR